MFCKGRVGKAFFRVLVLLQSFLGKAFNYYFKLLLRVGLDYATTITVSVIFILLATGEYMARYIVGAKELFRKGLCKGFNNISATTHAVCNEIRWNRQM